MNNLIQFSETSIFKSFKIMVVVAFVLGGWFTTMQLTQLNISERSKANEKKIELIESNDDISEIKTMLKEMSIYIKQSQKEIEELKKK